MDVKSLPTRYFGQTLSCHEGLLIKCGKVCVIIAKLLKFLADT